MYPPSMTRNGYRDVIGRSKEHGLTRVLRQDILDCWLLRRILPLNTEAQQQNMTWTKTMQWTLWLASGDPKEWKKLKGLAQCRGSVDYNAYKWQSAVFKGDSKNCWIMLSRDCLACSFQFFPHPDRRVPIFDLTRSRRITHAQYKSPSVSLSSFF